MSNAKLLLSNAIACLAFAIAIVLFAMFNIMTGVIICSIILGFYLCLVADQTFTDKLKEDKNEDPYNPYAEDHY